MFPVTLKTPTNTTITVTELSNPSRSGYIVRDVHKDLPTIVSFGYSSSERLDTINLEPSYPFDLQADDLIILQVVGVACQSYTPAGFQVLYGPDSSGPVQQWLYYRFATGNEVGNVKFSCPGDMKMAIMYNFRGVAQTDFIEGSVYGYGNSSSIMMPTVTTTGNSRLAVSFIFVGTTARSHDSIYFLFSGSEGGAWGGPFGGSPGYFGSSSYPIEMLMDFQVAIMENRGTVSGGTVELTNPAFWGIRAFSLIPN